LFVGAPRFVVLAAVVVAHGVVERRGARAELATELARRYAAEHVRHAGFDDAESLRRCDGTRDRSPRGTQSAQTGAR
jgi:hypothetical protein